MQAIFNGGRSTTCLFSAAQWFLLFVHFFTKSIRIKVVTEKQDSILYSLVLENTLHIMRVNFDLIFYFSFSIQKNRRRVLFIIRHEERRLDDMQRHSGHE